MKMAWLILAGVIAVTGGVRAASEAKLEVTGSHIPQEVRRVGMDWNTMAPVLVLDRQFINRTGRQTVGQVLRQIPQVVVRGY
jgi:outer membrane cobalamin receptor